MQKIMFYLLSCIVFSSVTLAMEGENHEADRTDKCLEKCGFFLGRSMVCCPTYDEFPAACCCDGVCFFNQNSPIYIREGEGEDKPSFLCFMRTNIRCSLLDCGRRLITQALWPKASACCIAKTGSCCCLSSSLADAACLPFAPPVDPAILGCYICCCCAYYYTNECTDHANECPAICQKTKSYAKGFKRGSTCLPEDRCCCCSRQNQDHN